MHRLLPERRVASFGVREPGVKKVARNEERIFKNIVRQAAVGALTLYIVSMTILF